ncbi:DUF4130 domain-containing protein [Desulfuromonas versatilis]|uniref:DUF4130 domain-containing protein n=1 Tax=Desulfuromonas versatilis TaxID=2802975 RepID=UPI001C85F01C|nr:DUF4130 domain-containing protein [Desulfuromonas versatilis]
MSYQEWTYLDGNGRSSLPRNIFHHEGHEDHEVKKKTITWIFVFSLSSCPSCSSWWLGLSPDSGQFFRKNRRKQRWCACCDRIAIPERRNPRLQRSFMPMKYWENLVEMNRDRG